MFMEIPYFLCTKKWDGEVINLSEVPEEFLFDLEIVNDLQGSSERGSSKIFKNAVVDWEKYREWKKEQMQNNNDNKN